MLKIKHIVLKFHIHAYSPFERQPKAHPLYNQHMFGAVLALITVTTAAAQTASPETHRPARPVGPPRQTPRQLHKETAIMRTLLLLLCAPLLFPQGGEIPAMLQNSEPASTRGALAAFTPNYAPSPETTFTPHDSTH